MTSKVRFFTRGRRLGQNIGKTARVHCHLTEDSKFFALMDFFCSLRKKRKFISRDLETDFVMAGFLLAIGLL